MADIEDESETGIQDESEAVIEDEYIAGGYGGVITPTGACERKTGFNRGTAGAF